MPISSPLADWEPLGLKYGGFVHRLPYSPYCSGESNSLWRDIGDCFFKEQQQGEWESCRARGGVGGDRRGEHEMLELELGVELALECSDDRAAA